MAQSTAKQYTVSEEIANSVTHGIGVVLSIAGLSVLVTFAALWGDAWRVVSFSIYGATMVLLYLASTSYHIFRNPRIKAKLRVLDHSAIFLLIAGTYTPFSLVSMRGPWGWTIFGLIWGLAIAGIIVTGFFMNRLKYVDVILYIAMGWLVVIAIKPLYAAVGGGGFVWLLAGGLSYTLGTVFYVWHKIPFNHAIWHLFVLGGTICHFFGMLFYVLPMQQG